MIGVNKAGKPQIFYDMDTSLNTITVNIEGFEGYAFTLIYSDLKNLKPTLFRKVIA